MDLGLARVRYLIGEISLDDLEEACVEAVFAHPASRFVDAVDHLLILTREGELTEDEFRARLSDLRPDPMVVSAHFPPSTEPPPVIRSSGSQVLVLTSA